LARIYLGQDPDLDVLKSWMDPNPDTVKIVWIPNTVLTMWQIPMSLISQNVLPNLKVMEKFT
jgi:hypothetical protein